jgi:hypothetical protein
VREALEQEPDPRHLRHPEFRWHTHEQCLFSLVSALRGNSYKRNLWFCWTMERERVRKLGQHRHCAAPMAAAARAWFPANASRRGHCLGVECPHLRETCARHLWMLPWIRTQPGSGCERAFRDPACQAAQ